jgi:hypothetical protein
MSELQLSFHGTFALKKEDILRILKPAKEEKGVNDTKENLVIRTGLGNEKVLRIKTWSIRSGLVDKKTGNLTPQGQIVLARDPHLESPVTDWLMHFYLSFGDYGLSTPPADPAEWGGWTWFIYSFLPTHPSFIRTNLAIAACNIYETEKKKAKDISKDISYIIRAYTETEALAKINFLTSPTKDHFTTQEASLPNDLLFAYFLTQIWQRDFGISTSTSADCILDHPFGLAPLLNISRDRLQDYLDRLSGFGIIEQYRTVPPFQVISRWQNPLQLLEKAYESDRSH